MTKKSKILMLLAALMLLGLFLFPLWKIRLEAPQYPDGVNMYIWVNKITGDTPSTLQNINILNHYIGMRFIEPDSIPELKYFPIVIMLLVVLGIGTAFSRKKGFFVTWGILLIVLGTLGIYDFYLWEYDYGHNLSPNAPIKIPGMVYQPPLFGSKMLLNFNAISYPHYGSIFILISMILNISSWTLTWKKNKTMIERTGLLLLICCCCVSCQPKERAIQYGHEECRYCKMTVMDNRFGTEVVTKKSKVYVFDSVECLVDFLHSDDVDVEAVKLAFITPFDQPGTLVPVEDAWFLHSKNLPSPMGMYLSAYASRERAELHKQKYDGYLLGWNDLFRTYKSLKKKVRQ